MAIVADSVEIEPAVGADSDKEVVQHGEKVRTNFSHDSSEY